MPASTSEEDGYTKTSANVHGSGYANATNFSLQMSATVPGNRRASRRHPVCCAWVSVAAEHPLRRCFTGCLPARAGSTPSVSHKTITYDTAYYTEVGVIITSFFLNSLKL